LNQEEGKKGGGIHQPFYGTWVPDFMLRQDAGKSMLGKNLGDTKFSGSQGDVWGWQWQELRQQALF